MIKFVLKISFAFALVFILSCSEDFNPFGEFRDNYVVTAILKSDTTYQTIFLSHNYLPPDGFDPYSNTVDPSIQGADIRVWIGDSVYVFRDTSVVREDTTRYKTPFYFYYNNQFAIPVNQNIEIEVLLQDGRRLRASSQTPGEITFSDESDVVIPAVGSDLVKFKWNQQAEGSFYSPKLTIRYKKNENGTIVEKLKEVPINYIRKNGIFEPVFPEPSNKSIVIYQLDAITRALNEISEGDPNKQNYSIYQKPVFDLAAFDLNLSRYVSSTNQTFDDLTVTVNESDYTNIEGGLGIFGSYNKATYTTIKFVGSYIQSFGYNLILDE